MLCPTTTPVLESLAGASPAVPDVADDLPVAEVRS